MHDISVTLPSRAWDALLEILRSHNAEHGDFDITTVISLHSEITNQIGKNENKN
jgi:hypothetical protein